MIGNLTNPEIEDLLLSNVIARIGCHAYGVTYVVPTCYAYDGEFVYCHSEEGMKIDMMRQNPAVCFEVDSLDSMANWKSLIAWGKFEEAEVHGVVYKLRLTKKTGRYEEEGDSPDTGMAG